MSKANENHPINNMRNTSEHLREQTLFAAKQAQNNASKARQSNANLAKLDIKGLFDQLHQMVELVGGKPRHAIKNAEDRSRFTLPKAAE